MILLNVDSIEWMIFLNEYFWFCFELNIELNSFLARLHEKKIIFKAYPSGLYNDGIIYGATKGWHSLVDFPGNIVVAFSLSCYEM